jgi:RHS repeat-associated protein
VGIDINGFNPSGTFTLTVDGQTTGPIAYNASAATVLAALEALSNIAPGDVAVVKTQEGSFVQRWRLSFQGALAGAALPQTTIDASSVQLAHGSLTEVEQTDTQGGPNNETQVVTISDASGGTFTLSFGGQTTAAIAWNADAATVDAALEALSTIDTVSVSGSAGGPWTVAFTGTHAGQDVASLATDGSGLTSSNLVRTLSFAYSAAGELVSASDPAATYTYSYDALSRVTSEGQTIAGLTPGITYESIYDALSRRTELQAVVGGTDDFQNTYTYDNLSRLTRLQQQDVGGGNVVADKRIDFAYDASGAFTKISRYADQAATEFVANTFFSYDGMGRLSKLLHTEDATAPGSGWGTDPLAGYEYTYDAASRITSIDSMVDGLTSYSYDNTDQLTAADHTGQTDETYTYDENGNRTMSGYATTDNNQLTTDGTYNYTYDDEGNRLTKTKISNGEKEEYTWDHRNRLTKVTFKNSGGTVVKTVDQTYDVFNRWIKRQVDPDGATGSATLVDTYFSHLDNQIALEFDGPDAADLTHRYLWGPVIDQILADEAVSSLASAGEVLWPLTDHLGTPRDLAEYDPGTDDTSIANHRRYDAYGFLVSETNGNINLLIGYTGRPFDESTGLNNHWHRWFTFHVWLNEDPIGFVAGDTNLIRYVDNDPTNATDPSGLAGVGTKNHVYPLYLGGAPDGVGYDFPCEDDHLAFHRYLSEQGYSKGRPDEAREAWKKLSNEQRKKILADAMRAVGASEKWIEANMDEVLKGATPGVKAPRRDDPTIRPDPDRSAKPKKAGKLKAAVSSGSRAGTKALSVINVAGDVQMAHEALIAAGSPGHRCRYDTYYFEDKHGTYHYEQQGSGWGYRGTDAVYDSGEKAGERVEVFWFWGSIKVFVKQFTDLPTYDPHDRSDPRNIY